MDHPGNEQPRKPHESSPLRGGAITQALFVEKTCRPHCPIGGRRLWVPAFAATTHYPCTALAKLAKNSSASFLAEPLMRRCPSWASLPPICASTSYLSMVPPSFSVNPTTAPPLAKPATPPSPSPEIL